MGTVKDVLDRLDSFDIDKSFEQIIKENESKIIELNIKNQLYDKGIDSKNRIIGVYSKATEYISTNNALLGRGNDIKKAGDPYTLFDTGKLSRSWKLKYENDTIYFFATDNKLSEVFATIKKHGLISDPESIFGLTIDNQKILRIDFLEPQFLSKFRRATSL